VTKRTEQEQTTTGVYRDTGPFAIIPEWVLDAPMTDRAVRLYAVLARYADQDGKAFPSRRTLARRLKCSLDSLDRARRELEKIGALATEPRQDERGQTTNLYVLLSVPPPLGTGREDPLGTDAEDPLGTGREQNDNQGEREPLNENTIAADAALATSDGTGYDPLKGTRIDGRNLPFDALVRVTQADERVEGSKLGKALKTIRKLVVEDYAIDNAMDLADPAATEAFIADRIMRRAALYRSRWPNVELTPTALASNWTRVTTGDGRSAAEAVDVAQHAIDQARGES
jgi:Helix-turn-helix domain